MSTIFKKLPPSKPYKHQGKRYKPSTHTVIKKKRTKEQFFKMHDKYLKTRKWNSLRLMVLRRADYKCESCGNSGVILHVHHLTYERWRKECLSDLKALCIPCHNSEHGHS